MNQDQVKNLLLKLDNTVDDFTVTFSGSSSKKVDGLYKPDGCEIIIHNHNFNNDNSLIYTAIHEFAHHVQFTRSPVPVSSKAHANNFWDIFHKLLFEAEEKGIYKNVFDSEKRFLDLTKKIKENFISVNGKIIKEFGLYLVEALKLCHECQASFEDYVDRVLGLHRTTARSIMKISQMDINPEIGYENMKTVASIKDENTARKAEAAFLEGQTPDMVKAQYTSRKRPENKLEYLLTERDRIEHTIDTLTIKLVKIEQEINSLKN